ncbi:GH39 family glycosyl hydrolase [Dyadobacter sp. CY323]|uniref:GH39 family glycosyl hydrolase n=1 Tax=Dyadobacter sp. CY323 TaxID=2907302 RepID=UPI001F47EC7C|nr:hypothetical protein [Dyadobacter sp. CY323]MCE6991210.1 hypothetical protein [Dyadobacter sp. CY323]
MKKNRFQNLGRWVAGILLASCTGTGSFAQSPAGLPAGPQNFKEIGSVKTRSAKEIKASSWSIGGETMDRDYTDYQSYKKYLDALGAKRIRLQGGWAKCEKVKGKYDFAWLDAVIPDAYSRGVNPWVELSYGNPIYEGGGEPKLAGRIPTSPEALEAWDKWVKAIVNRYKGQVTEWEIWNEPDLNPKNTGDEFADFYIRTANVVRSQQPNAKFLALGIAGVPRLEFLKPFLDKIKAKNALDLIDVITYHGYAPNPDTSYPKIEEMRNFVAGYSTKIGFMQGENGAPSTHSSVTIGALRQFDWTELSQAKWDLRRMLGDHGRGIATNLFTISDIHYAAGDHMTGVNTKGILKTNPDKTIDRPKLAYKAAQHVFSIFDSEMEAYPGNTAATDHENQSAFIYKQKGTGNTVITIWGNEARPAETYTNKRTKVTASGSFKEPVYVDLISGKVYEIPKANWKKEGGNSVFNAIPVPDYPVLIAEKSAFGLATASLDEKSTFKYLGKIAPRDAKDIKSSNWSVGAEMMDRDFTIYNNWKEYLGKLGAKKARIQSGWAKVEKTKGSYDWVWLDEIVYDMVKQGVKPWINLSYGNTLYSGGGGTTLMGAVPQSDEALEGWGKFVNAIVSRYGKVVDDWEVWNEPNYKVSPEGYAKLLVLSAEIIRKVQPKDNIIAFAMGSKVDYEYADKVLAIMQQQNKIHLIDEISHHRHIKIPEDRGTEIALEAVVKKYNPKIRIRQGEGGCPSEWNDNFALNKYHWSEQIQSKHILRRLLTDLGNDKESCLFTIMDARYPQEWNHKGLLKANNDKTVAYAKPAYYAFQNVTSVFDDRLTRLEKFPYAIKKHRDRKVSLYGYAGKGKQSQIVTAWFSDSIPSNVNDKTLCDLSFGHGSFENPVWVDLASGSVHEIPKSNWKKEGTNFHFSKIPMYDSPILIAEKSLIRLAKAL